MELCGVSEISDNTNLCLVAEEKLARWHWAAMPSVPSPWFSEGGLGGCLADDMSPVLCGGLERVCCFAVFIFLQSIKFMQLSGNVCFLRKNEDKG